MQYALNSAKTDLLKSKIKLLVRVSGIQCTLLHKTYPCDNTCARHSHKFFLDSKKNHCYNKFFLNFGWESADKSVRILSVAEKFVCLGDAFDIWNF